MKFLKAGDETPNEFHGRGIENPCLWRLREDNLWQLQFEKQYVVMTFQARYLLCDLVRQEQHTEKEHCNVIKTPKCKEP